MKVCDLVLHQLKMIYMMSEADSARIARSGVLDRAEESAMRAVSGFLNKYNTGKIDPINGVMYTNYLYWLSRYLFETGDIEAAAEVYGLNKMFHSVDLFYEIKLPQIWSCEHPLGAVMGRAQYGERFFFYQGCTVGGNRHNGEAFYPIIGNNVLMYSNSKILGDSKIGNNVIIAANAYVINQVVPDNSIVFGQSPNIIIKANHNECI